MGGRCEERTGGILVAGGRAAEDCEERGQEKKELAVEESGGDESYC